MVAVGENASSGANQNNKYYDMIDTEDGNFKVEYGRIGTSGQVASFPISKWQSTYNSKVKKGYKDVTSLYVEDNGKIIGFSDISDRMVSTLIARLQAYANKQVVANYNISSEKVTLKQVEEAQSILNELTQFASNLKDISDIEKANKVLLNLYATIPRKMGNVRDYLLVTTDDSKFNRVLTTEQDLLDTMAGQVKQAVLVRDNTDDKLTILDALGLELLAIKPEETAIIKTKLQELSDKFVNGFKVINKKTQKGFDEHLALASDKTCELLWHGSRSENWMSILESGLVIRPTNAVYSGSMFGDGVYFADKARKSYGYTSGRGSYWARGNENEAFMALYNVHLGKQLVVESSDYSLSANKLKEKGDFDSTFAKAGRSLVNNEYIIYNKNQSTVQYLVQLNG